LHNKKEPSYKHFFFFVLFLYYFLFSFPSALSLSSLSLFLDRVLRISAVWFFFTFWMEMGCGWQTSPWNASFVRGSLSGRADPSSFSAKLISNEKDCVDGDSRDSSICSDGLLGETIFSRIPRVRIFLVRVAIGLFFRI